MNALRWLLRAAFFFLIFALALNNTAPVVVHGLFGTRWEGPLALVLLIVLLLGVLLGMAVMAPMWWRARRLARRETVAPSPSPATSASLEGRRSETDWPDAV
ncbi:Lipopolysaccharide assembly protein A [Tepidimonas alkaliphilus]|uniref:Lipopolysaccharide assembly protein A n=1 Tax=Tepidimonas alkaliphilus TaxID=2588942 RepID=A0A554W463_9BURK|nr:lipopolysaccharide assembly protein LapA domain-containing protein [Tepidimonas alkaliphilus]TSE18352.1 Lipopolysaccharide assembly protein A [Tepidimonas alkaliphilus]